MRPADVPSPAMCPVNAYACLVLPSGAADGPLGSAWHQHMVTLRKRAPAHCPNSYREERPAVEQAQHRMRHTLWHDSTRVRIVGVTAGGGADFARPESQLADDVDEKTTAFVTQVSEVVREIGKVVARAHLDIVSHLPVDRRQRPAAFVFRIG